MRNNKLDNNLPQASNCEPQTNYLTLENLHPLVKKTAEELYINGHYRQTILDTYILLIETVRKKSKQSGYDGSTLMEIVFSPKNPILKVSDNSKEQLDFMKLFSGAVIGITNPKSQTLIPQDDPQRVLEWLSFASILFRVLDETEFVKPNKLAKSESKK